MKLLAFGQNEHSNQEIEEEDEVGQNHEEEKTFEITYQSSQWVMDKDGFVTFDKNINKSVKKGIKLDKNFQHADDHSNMLENSIESMKDLLSYEETGTFSEILVIDDNYMNIKAL